MSATAVDLTDVRITKGVNFDFPAGAALAPGASTVVAANGASFAARYGAGRPVAGIWSSGSLAHKGEEIKLAYGSGQAIVDFTYSNAAPWPAIAAGSGYSLTLIQPATLPDPTNPANWRKSYYPGGNPGGGDAITYAAWAAAYPGVANNASGDLDGDGLSNLTEYALGGNPLIGNVAVAPRAGVQSLTVNGVTANYLTISFKRLSDASDLTYHVEFSPDLATWSENGVLAGSVSDGAGMLAQTWRAPLPVTASGKLFARMRVTAP